MKWHLFSKYFENENENSKNGFCEGIRKQLKVVFTFLFSFFSTYQQYYNILINKQDFTFLLYSKQSLKKSIKRNVRIGLKMILKIISFLFLYWKLNHFENITK